jgi:Zn-dependent protease with chaperone function
MDELAQARALLPLGVRLAPWLFGPALGLFGYLAARGVLSVPEERRGADGQPEPWWERARVVFPVRQLGVSTRVLGFFAGLVVAGLTVHSWVAPGEGRFLLTVALAWAGPLLAALRFDARLRERSFRDVLRSWAALGAVAYSSVYAIVVFGEVASSLPGAASWIAAVLGTAVVAWLAAGGGLPLAKALGLARPARERVQAAVARASARVGVPCAEVLEMDSLVVNALAFPLARRVVFTRAAVEALDDDELEAVAAHELGHLAEPLALRLFRPAMITLVASFSLVLPKVPLSLEALAGVLVTAAVVVLLARRRMRRAERDADAHAKDETGTYARALEKVYALNLVPAVLRRGGSHGHLYDRLVAAGRTPSWPRPPPPVRAPLRARLWVASVAAVVPLVILLAVGNPQTTDEAQAALALGNSSGWPVEALARAASHDGRFDDALVLYRAARALSPGEPFLSGALVVALRNAGHCDEATTELAQLQQRVQGLSLRPDEQQALELATRAVDGCQGSP